MNLFVNGLLKTLGVKSIEKIELNHEKHQKVNKKAYKRNDKYMKF